MADATGSALGDFGPRKRSRDMREEDSADEATPTTTESECGGPGGDADSESEAAEEAPQVGPGLFDDEPHAAAAGGELAPSPHTANYAARLPAALHEGGGGGEAAHAVALFVFDWDDTIFPSSWVLRQGLRLDEGSVLSDWQRERLAEVAASASEVLRLARRLGRVVILTNAERGWVELSSTKFAPALLPVVEGVRVVSARSTYETEDCASPLQWKVRAFRAEIARTWGAEAWTDSSTTRHVHSLGDSMHEREALKLAAAELPNCSAKSVKFVERPEIDHLLRQHALVADCLEKIAQHEGDLDLGMSC